MKRILVVPREAEGGRRIAPGVLEIDGCLRSETCCFSVPSCDAALEGLPPRAEYLREIVCPECWALGGTVLNAEVETSTSPTPVVHQNTPIKYLGPPELRGRLEESQRANRLLKAKISRLEEQVRDSPLFARLTAELILML